MVYARAKIGEFGAGEAAKWGVVFIPLWAWNGVVVVLEGRKGQFGGCRGGGRNARKGPKQEVCQCS